MKEQQSAVQVSEMPRVVDLGAGVNPVSADALTVDYNQDNSPDVVHDLEETPWPLPTDYFEEVCMRHTLEHLDKWKAVLQEMVRITRPGGSIHITVPHFSNSIRYPDHVNHFSLRGITALFRCGSSMTLGLNAEITELELRYCYNRASLKGKIGYVLNPVVDSRFRNYIGRYFWPFIGGIDEIYWEMEVKG